MKKFSIYLLKQKSIQCIKLQKKNLVFKQI